MNNLYTDFNLIFPEETDAALMLPEITKLIDTLVRIEQLTPQMPAEAFKKIVQRAENL